MIPHTVQQGECTDSLAIQYGHFPETVWQHAANKDLRAQRASRNVLAAGDVLQVPEIRPKQVAAATSQRHRYVRRGVPAVLRLQLVVAGQPRANEAYVLTIDGEMSEGALDGSGWLIKPILPSAQSATLVLTRTHEVFELALRRLDPVDSVRGAQGRLSNLGYYRGEVNGTMDDATHAALKSFQELEGLAISGELDAATQGALKRAHGS